MITVIRSIVGDTGERDKQLLGPPMLTKYFLILFEKSSFILLNNEIASVVFHFFQERERGRKTAES